MKTTNEIIKTLKEEGKFRTDSQKSFLNIINYIQEYEVQLCVDVQINFLSPLIYTIKIR